MSLVDHHGHILDRWARRDLFSATFDRYAPDYILSFVMQNFQLQPFHWAILDKTCLLFQANYNPEKGGKSRTNQSDQKRIVMASTSLTKKAM